MAFLFRRPGPLIVLGTSALGGAAYRYTGQPSSSTESLNPHTFTPYTLVDKKPVSQTSAIFTLRNHDGASAQDSLKEAWQRSVWSVQVKQPQLQIARAYTPLPPPSDAHGSKTEELQDIRLLVRKENNGEVSTYLHRLPEQSTIELRGPRTECELPEDIKEVIFLAGGTGIAPAMQVAHSLGSKAGSQMHILWANRRKEECIGGVSNEDEATGSTQQSSIWWKRLVGLALPEEHALAIGRQNPQSSQEKGVMVQELDALKKRSAAQSSHLAVQYYVDEEMTVIKPADVAKRIAPGTPNEEGGSRVIFVSGPDGFIEYWAGKKIWVGGREQQGPLRGVLGQMDLKGWSVFKL